jgi:putative Mg2+ transporter-C (MgtC) family protein
MMLKDTEIAKFSLRTLRLCVDYFLRRRSMETIESAWIESVQNFGWVPIGQIVLSAVLGGLIGIEREWRGRDAGFRTNMLIAMGTCLFTILSIHGFPLDDSAAQDSARVAAQVVSGIGFLGAGALFQTRQHTKGMTTAATIWMVAAIGMTVGVGAYTLAIISSAITLIALRFLRPVSKFVSQRKSNNSSVEDGQE